MSNSKKKNLRRTEHISSKGDSIPRNALLSKIVHRLGHEIGNPLTSIISLSSILERLSMPDSAVELDSDKLSQYSMAIGQEAWKISRLNETMVHLLSDKEVSTYSCGLRGLLEKTISRFESRNSAPLRNIDFILNVSPQLQVQAEPDRLIFIFGELFKNALAAYNEFGEPDEVYSLRVEANEIEHDVKIRVVNQIQKPSSRELELLFEPMVKEFNNPDNSGLGLAVVSCLTSNLGGSIAIEEEITTEGVFFAVELVLKSAGQEKESSPTNSSSTKQDKGLEASSSEARVIIVDDEETVSSAIKKILEVGFAKKKLNCQCINGREALALLEKNEEFDVMLCDLNLNRMSGRHIFEQLLEKCPENQAKFAFLTGDQARKEAITYLNSIGRPYLLKPFEPEELVDLVSKLLG